MHGVAWLFLWVTLAPAQPLNEVAGQTGLLATPAAGLRARALLTLPPGRALAMAGGQPGELWVLLDDPRPALPGNRPEGDSPRLVRVLRNGLSWRVADIWPVPAGCATLAARDQAILLGAPGKIWEYDGASPAIPPRLLLRSEEDTTVAAAIPVLNQAGQALAVLSPGLWAGNKNGSKKVLVPGGAWGVVRLTGDGTPHPVIHATGLGRPSGWAVCNEDGEILTADLGVDLATGGAGRLHWIWPGNDLGFRKTTGRAGRLLTDGLGAMTSPLVTPWVASCGMALGGSLGPDWDGVALLANSDQRKISAHSFPRKGATRQAAEVKVMLQGPATGFYPVAMAEDPAGLGVWVLDGISDESKGGRLPLELHPSAQLWLVDHPEWLKANPEQVGPVPEKPTARQMLECHRPGLAMWAAARRLARQSDRENPWVERLADLALDNTLDSSLRLAACCGVEASGNAGAWAARFLGSDLGPLRLAGTRMLVNSAQPDPKAIEPLVACLEDPDQPTRRAAGLAAGMVAAPGAAEALAVALFQQEETDPQVLDGFLRGLCLLGAQGAERVISAAQTGVRAEALRALRARVSLPWRPGQCGDGPVWLEHPHLGPEHHALYLQGLRAWQGAQWNEKGPLGEAEEPAMAALRWLQDHPEQQSDVLEAGLLLLDATQGRAEGVEEWLKTMALEKKGAVCHLTLDLLGRMPPPAWSGEVAMGLEREGLSSVELAAGIRLMRLWGQKGAALRQAVPLLEPGALPGQENILTVEALETLAAFDPQRGLEAARRVLESPHTGVSAGRLAAHLLAVDSKTRRSVTDFLMSQKNPGKILPLWIDSLAERVHADPTTSGAAADLNRLLESVWLQNPLSPDSLDGRIRTQGDASRGLFLALDRKKAGCSGCHTLSGAGGGALGPPLVLNGTSPSPGLGELLNSMVRPSARQRPEYQALRLKTRAGQVLRGRLLAGTADRVRLLDADGKVHNLSAAEVVESQADNHSIMPELGSLALTDQEMLDLLAFLTRQAPPKGQAAVEERLAGLVIEAEVRLGGKWRPVFNDAFGWLVLPADAAGIGEPLQIRFQVQPETAGQWQIRLAGAALANGQPATRKLGPGWQTVQVLVTVPLGQRQMALRLQGPQGCRIRRQLD